MNSSNLQVSDASAKQQVLSALVDQTSSRILQATQERPRSILELSQLLSFTPARIRDSLQGLVEAGIVAPIKSPGSAEGYRYQATVRRVNITLTNLGLEMEVDAHAGIPGHSLKRFLAMIGQPIPAEAS